MAAAAVVGGEEEAGGAGARGEAVVVGLITYPVKGCAGVRVTESDLTPAGLAHDRTFMVVDPAGVYRTQRATPRLAVVRPEVSWDGGRLTLRAPDAEPLDIAVDTESARRDVDLFGAPFTGIDQGEAAARWLSRVLGTESRLVRVPPEHDRRTDGLHPGTSGYADSGALHMLSRATFDDLNRRITEAGRTAVTMSRLRPNVVVDGWDEPHREDRPLAIRIGNTELGFAKPALRCAVTLVDQASGERAGPEPLRTLATYRRQPGGGVALGAKYSVLRTGKLAVGDQLTVTAWQTGDR
ncbi:MOSC domain-containing protein [Streptomyces longispororuber]|uniref:MOSC domain-containing protein n=1 Tax=Streptomyces longispororuber TaxID=68230 RepID=UPI0036F5CA8D